MRRCARPALTFLLSLLALGPVAGAQLKPGPPVAPIPVDVTPPPSGLVRLQTPAGALVGRSDGQVSFWQGIPYAQPPTGDARWKAPRPALPWKGDRSALTAGPPCPQKGAGSFGLVGSEDCLTLNVAAPSAALGAGAAPLPVMVWIHGGAFTSGSGSQYDPRLLTREQNVVVVTLNYRLGALGFLATDGLATESRALNYGLQDQQAALRWVKANIRAFGGDPGNVTLFGESAGSMSICAHLTSPLAAGLFHKAIMQSGSCAAPGTTIPQADARRTGAAFAQEVGCRGGDPACLRAVPLARLISTPIPGRGELRFLPLTPAYGDVSLPTEPAAAFRGGKAPRLPVLLGTNRDEGTLFVGPLGDRGGDLPLLTHWGLAGVLAGWNAPRALAAYPTAQGVGVASARLITDAMFACPARTLARQLAAVTPTYMYEFRDPDAPTDLLPTGSAPRYGAFHASELISVFGTPLTYFASPTHFTPAQGVLARQIRSYWANFARTGNPNGPGLPTWAPVTPTQDRVLALEPGRVQELNTFAQDHRCDLWP